MKHKTKPEEPRKREVKFVCQAEHWKSACKADARHELAPQMRFLSLLGFHPQEHKLAHWGTVFRNSCRMRRSALLRRMASLSMNASDVVVGLQGEISSAHCGPCTWPPDNATTSTQTVGKRLQRVSQT